MSDSARALLYVAADIDGSPRLLAALERDAATGTLRMAPDADRVSERDTRGRRTQLGALLSAPRTAGEDDLADAAAHLLPLPDLGQSAAPPTVDLRLVGLDASAFGSSWPAPGGGQFNLRPRPLRLPGARTGALLASRGAPGGPWLRPIGDAPVGVANLLSLLAELGLRTTELPLLAPWIDAAVDGGSSSPVGGRCLAALRELVQSSLLGREVYAATVESIELELGVRAVDEGLLWTFELRDGGEVRNLEHRTAGYSPDAAAELLAVLDAQLQPWWLLAFDAVDDQGPSFVGLVDLRRYLVENLEALEGPAA